MTKKNYIIFLCFLLLSSLRGWSASNMGFGVVYLSADTVRTNDTLTVYTSLINYGPDEFNGTIDFSIAINGVENANRSLLDNTLQGQSITIAPNDSFPMAFHIIVQQQYMVPGSDIFVVWPIFRNGNNVHDSLRVHMYVTEATAVDEISGTGELKMRYYNQSIIINSSLQPEPLQIGVFDLTGKEICTGQVAGTGAIPFVNQPSGVYFVQITFADNRRKVFKMVKLDR